MLNDSHMVIGVNIVDVRHDPDPVSELVTQALMNVPVCVGEVSGEWTQITLADYKGWVLTVALEQPIVHGFCIGEGTCGVPLPFSVVVTAPCAPLYAHEEGDERISEVYLSTVLPYIDLERPHRLRVALPGDGEGWLSRVAVSVRSNTDLFPRQERSAVTAYARQFLGRPYVWGGTAWPGLDCSGLVQLCYRMGGHLLPRDADQQHDALAPQTYSRAEMQEGDLIFFGQDQITHVALALNQYEYIHAEGVDYQRVIIHSFDPQAPDYHPRLASLVLAIKRVV